MNDIQAQIDKWNKFEIDIKEFLKERGYVFFKTKRLLEHTIMGVCPVIKVYLEPSNISSDFYNGF